MVELIDHTRSADKRRDDDGQGTARQLFSDEYSGIKVVPVSAPQTPEPAGRPEPVPALELVDSQGSAWRSASNLTSAFGHGAWSEVSEHPFKVLGIGAAGFAVGLAVTMVAPEVALAVGAIGLASSLYMGAGSARQWYRDASVVAHPERYDSYERFKAAQGIADLGAGAVDMAAGMVGGYAGMRLGYSSVFAAFKTDVTNHFRPVNLDDAGRPTKLPMPNGNGSVYLQYDSQGQIIGIEEDPKHGWTALFKSEKGADGALKWTVSAEHTDAGVGYKPFRWDGTIALQPDLKGVTISDSLGTLKLRAEGASELVRTAAQTARAREITTALNAEIAQIQSDRPLAGAAAAARGMAMMIR